MRPTLIHGAIVFVACLCAISPAFANRTATRVPRTQISERLNPTEISQSSTDMSAAIYGFIADEASVAVKYPTARGDPTVYVNGLGTSPQRICIQIRRAQGGYSALFSASVPSGSGVAEIPFDSSPAARAHLAESRLSAYEMAIKATMGVKNKCPSAGEAPLLPASWNSTGNSKYTLLVGGAATGTPRTRVGGAESKPCRLISQILQRSDLGAGIYAYACEIQLPVDSCRAPTPIKILWFRGSRVAGEAKTSVVNSCKS